MDFEFELGLVIPTNEPNVAFEYLLKSLGHLESISSRIVLLFNFQKPYTDSQINKVVEICEFHNLKYRVRFTEYDIKGQGMVPVVRIRHDSASLAYCKYYMLADDDFTFLSGSAQQLSRVLDYMNSHPSCGSALLKGKDKDQGVKNFVIRPCRSFRIRCITDKGIILRSIPGGVLFPEDALSLVGSDEEKVAVTWRIHQGYYPVLVYNTRIRHYENSSSNKKEKRAVPGSVMHQWNKKSILKDNVNKFIKEKFYPEFDNRGGVPTVLYDINTYEKISGVSIDDLEEVVYND